MLPLSLETFLGQLDTLELPDLVYPAVYPDRSLVKLFLYAAVKGIVGFKTLARQVRERPDLLSLCGLVSAPHRVTLSRRYKEMPDSLLHTLDQLSAEFLESGRVDASVSSADSTLMHAFGKVWHVKQMATGELPCPNIDTQAHWGMSGCKQWVFGYRLHSLVACGPDGLVWPLEVAVHAANIKDAFVFRTELICQLPEETDLVLGDGGYDDEQCAAACEEKEATLLTPVKRVGKSTPIERLERAELHRSPEGKEAFALRKTSVEPFQGQLKELFGLERLALKGLANVRALCIVCVLAYCLLVRLNVVLSRPPRELKATMLALR